MRSLNKSLCVIFTAAATCTKAEYIFYLPYDILWSTLIYQKRNAQHTWQKFCMDLAGETRYCWQLRHCFNILQKRAIRDWSLTLHATPFILEAPIQSLGLVDGFVHAQLAWICSCHFRSQSSGSVDKWPPQLWLNAFMTDNCASTS